MDDRLHAIFDRQKQLTLHFRPIESANGFHNHCPTFGVDLNNAFAQAKLKDSAWRVTEELTEATDHLTTGDHRKLCEEIIDAYHFLVEMSLIAGMEYIDCVPNRSPLAEDPLFPMNDGDDCLEELFLMAARAKAEASIEQLDIRLSAYAVIEYVGKACNALKNRPWRQSFTATDKGAFYANMTEAHVAFALLCIACNIDPQTLHDGYFHKSSINFNRIEEGR